MFFSPLGAWRAAWSGRGPWVAVCGGFLPLGILPVCRRFTRKRFWPFWLSRSFWPKSFPGNSLLSLGPVRPACWLAVPVAWHFCYGQQLKLSRSRHRSMIFLPHSLQGPSTRCCFCIFAFCTGQSSILYLSSLLPSLVQLVCVLCGDVAVVT